ncbi:DUF397 domain-containing protein [Streptomyces sp. SBT349]|uniref:DUF397 domain-containing protein n=1 Tax=Streptomyces sp. SBT349 TaxID=1580539 RepID=UPI00066C979E|nr:DUF397 domain-containing protein [Streptomyces sp. SBT349]
MSAGPDLTAAEWVKSSYSGGNGGQCVEFSRSFVPSGMIPVRDSKSTASAGLIFDTHAWAQFISVVKTGSDEQAHAS